MAPHLHSPHFGRGCNLAAGVETERDLPAARAEFAAGAAQGDVRAALVHSGFLAGGIGGPADWQGAVDILRLWSGRDALAARQLELISAMDLSPDGKPASTPPPQRLHSVKRIALIEGLLTPQECAFVMQMAGPRLQPATVLSAPDKSNMRPLVRDADAAMFTPLEEPPFLRAINVRIASATGTDVRQGEPLQLMRYRPGQQYRPHVDGVGGGANKRVMTAIVYLNEDYAGGETAFTELGLEVRGRQGGMLLFENLRDDGELDRDMRHAGLPVREGVKFIASRWILQRPPYDKQGNLIGKTLWS